MNGFKEWLSDHLRYLMLGLAALLFFILVLIGVRVWLLSGDAGGGEEIEILSARVKPSSLNCLNQRLPARRRRILRMIRPQGRRVSRRLPCLRVQRVRPMLLRPRTRR